MEAYADRRDVIVIERDSCGRECVGCKWFEYALCNDNDDTDGVYQTH